VRTGECAARAAEYLGVDEDGLRPAERRILAFLAGREGPVSLRTMHGRIATAKARARFGAPASPVAVASAREKVSGEKAELADRSARAALTPSARDREVGSRPHSESKPRERQATRRRIAYPLRIIAAVVAIVMAAGACEPEGDSPIELGPAAAARTGYGHEGLPDADPSKWQSEAQVRRKLRSPFFPIQFAVRGILADTIRVRSLVEKVNSRLRPYVYLDLLRLSFNHRRFMRSERAERVASRGGALLPLPGGSLHPPAVAPTIGTVDRVGADSAKKGGGMASCAWTRTAAGVIIVLLGSQPARPDVIITEILASNTAYEIGPGDTPDLVEIYNRGPDDITLAGPGTGKRMYLIDDPRGDYRRWWKFPVTTILKAGEYMTIACDASGKFGFHANFQIDAPGGVVALMDTDSSCRRIIDSVEYGLQYPNISYARFENPDGTHVWRYTSRPTFFFNGKPVCAKGLLLRASPVYCGDPSELCPSSPENILEETLIPDFDDLDYSPALVKATDEVKVTARVGPSPDRVAIDLHYVLVAPDGTVGQEVLVPMRDDGKGPDATRDCEGLTSPTNDTWWAARIPAQLAGTTVRFWAESYWKGPRPDPDPCRRRVPAEAFSLYTVENTDPRAVRINEVLAINMTGIRSPRGFWESWIEIFNSGTQEVDLAGLYLTTTPRNPTQWAFPLSLPSQTRIPAGGYLIVWPGQISRPHDRIYLANAKGVFDGIDWSRDPRRPCPCDLLTDEQDPDISMGRIPDGADFIARIDPPSPGAQNPWPGNPPVIRALRAAPDDPSCGIPCENSSFVATGDHLANPARVRVNRADVTGSVETLADGSLLVPAAASGGVSGSMAVWVYQGPSGAQVASKVRFRCVSTPFIRGDAAGDGRLDLADPIRILGFLFGGAILECEDTADLDDDGLLLLNDPIYLLNYLFSGGPPPEAPFFCCGADPTPRDGISCETYRCP